MTAKQTTLSASLGVLLVVSMRSAHAEPEAPQPAGEVHPEPPTAAETAAPGNVRAVDPPPAPPEPRSRTGTFELGAGYATDDEFIATAKIAQTNLFGTGKGLALEASLSARHQLVLMRFDDPSVFGSTLRMRGEIYDDDRLSPGFRRHAAGGALTFARPLTQHLTAFAGYRLEHVEVEPDLASVANRGTTPGAEPIWRGGLLATLRAGLAYSTLDQPSLPTRGTSVGASIEVADRNLGSDLGFLRTHAWATHHRALGPFTLHVGGTLGSISDGAPLSERLHFDGSRDIRGYAPGAIGPKDPRTGLPTGGNLMYTARGELELPVLPSLGLSAVGFVDAGGLYSADGGQSAISAGFGVIWRSPIGPLRFDWAFPLDGSGPRFVIGAGMTF